MSYKTPRLLIEAIHKEMAEMKKLLMQSELGSTNLEQAQDVWIDLRKLFDELAAMSDRPSIDDVLKLSPGEYVATMKPLVAMYHRSLMTANALAPALCEDLQASACVMIVVGDGNTVVRAAHDPSRPEVALAVETLIAAIDSSLNQIVSAGADLGEQQQQLGEVVPESTLTPTNEATLEKP